LVIVGIFGNCWLVFLVILVFWLPMTLPRILVTKILVFWVILGNFGILVTIHSSAYFGDQNFGIFGILGNFGILVTVHSYAYFGDQNFWYFW
jgi:hypothetical protein